MLINGVMVMTCNINEALNYIHLNQNDKCVFVGDSMGRYDMLFDSYGVIPASVLMPDYPCMEADINGTPGEFQQKYFMYLDTENPKSMIITLLAALHQCKNIILLVPPEASGLKYPFVLCEYLLTHHGIQILNNINNGVPSSYNPVFDPYNAMCLYSLNLIEPQEYLLYSGPNFTMLDKLCYDAHVQFPPNTPPEAIYNYFNEWRNNMLKAGKPLKKVFQFNHAQEGW